MPKLGDHVSRRRTIAGAAVQVIGELGLDAARLVDVARVGLVTTGAVTHYFDSKDALLEAALLEVVTRILESQAQTGEASLNSGELIDTIAAFLPLDQASLRDWRVWFAFSGRAVLNERLRSLHRQYYDEITRRLGQQLANLQARGQLAADADLGVLSDAIVAVIDGLGVRATLEPESWSPDRQKATLRLMLSPLLKSPRPN